jgi:hypothetical protein
MPTILRRIDWLKSGMGAGAKAEGDGSEPQYTGFDGGNTRNLAVYGASDRTQPSREPYSLTKVKSADLSAISEVPAPHPYFAALLRQRDKCETMPCHHLRHRFSYRLSLKPHTVADLGL